MRDEGLSNFRGYFYADDRRWIRKKTDRRKVRVGEERMPLSPLVALEEKERTKWFTMADRSAYFVNTLRFTYANYRNRYHLTIS